MRLSVVLLLVLGSATDAAYVRSPAKGDLSMDHIRFKKSAVDQVSAHGTVLPDDLEIGQSTGASSTAICEDSRCAETI